MNESKQQFQELFIKAHSLVKAHAPVQNSYDVDKIEEAIGYMEEARKIPNLSSADTENCEGYLAILKDTLDAGKEKLGL